MWIKACRCPKCRSGLIFEELGTYGDLHDIYKSSGKINHRIKRSMKYEHEDTMVYCLNCGTDYEHREIDGALWIRYEEEENE